MKQFCKDVLDFLHSEYDDAYAFDLEVSQDIYNRSEMTLKINICKGYRIKVAGAYMDYIFSLYRSGEYIQERKRWRWQKELVDIIEGS